MKLLNRLLLILSLFSPALAIADETPLLIHASRVFDGTNLKTNTSVLISNGKIIQIDNREAFKATAATVIDLGDATLLPGLIELHAHISFQHIPADTVLRNGITTLREVGGVVHTPYGGDGSLRVLTSGPILTAPNGYPIANMGADNLAIPITTEAEARATVRQLIKDGAVVIKIALEPGNEVGAPWSSGHHHGPEQHGHEQHSAHAEHGKKPPHTMPLLSEAIVKAIVDEAHQLNHKVTAHLAETNGVKIALNAGVDEWAHTPCDAIPENLLKQAVAQKVKIVSTFDTLSKCSGMAKNAHTLAALGAEFLYGSEIAHPEIPWGVDAQELNLMMQLTKLSPLEVLHTATAKAGQHLNIPLLGTIQNGAPADLIAIHGDVTHNFKPLEYPDLVISGGKIVVNHFAK